MESSLTSQSSVLIEADRASQNFWEEYMRSGVEDPHHKSLFRAMLGDPILRPLLELRENGATSIEGALLLKSVGFLNETVIAVPSGQLKGQRLTCVSLSKRAINCTSRWRMRIGDDVLDRDSFDFFKRCVRNYLVVDRGAGIAVTKAVAEVALDLTDERILGRLATLDYDLLQFDLDPFVDRVSDSDWMACEERWSRSSNLSRTGAAVIDLCNPW